MRTRSQSKRPRSVGEQETTKGESINDDETLPNISRDAVGKLLKRVKRGFKKEDVGYLRRCEHPTEMDGESKDTGRKPIGTTGGNDIAGPESLSQEAMEYALNPEMDDKDNDFDDSEWEDGSIPTLSSLKDFQEDIINGVSIDFDIPRGLEKRKPVRRATAEEKEVAELVHKAHLLCLLGRGRLIDCACNDPLIQASLLSLVPTHLLKVAESPKLTASHLLPLVNWFHNNFHVRSPNLAEKSCHLALASTLETREGTPEAVTALCVALLRALNLTTRYCTKWYKVAPQRVDSAWWDVVLAPLKELESAATAGIVNLECEASHLTNKDHGHLGVSKSTRSSLEDMELETRALTEPLPTNQQAYRNHPLYTIERWVKKYEILYPKGPVLGFCGGNPVYPRTCVQALHTKFRWLREGLQVKAGEVPVKVLNRSQKCNKDALDHDEHADGDHQDSTALYGKWQTEPLCLPQAVNGIVPKNERGQVDVWSEKCLPPGTVHLPFPRVAHVARRLEIDFAPAMVGFEFRNGRSLPVFEGIVVCSEFKDGILEAYLEEEERREAEEKRKNEAQALSRWYQLLSSIITRQRLNECYGKATASQSKDEPPKSADECRKSTDNTRKREASPGCQQVKKCDAPTPAATDNHEHEFILDEQVSGEEGSTRIKRCHCGFSIQFEEL
ncbi:hypothetical protein ACS0TY_028862 [Phlomoides rotata]